MCSSVAGGNRHRRFIVMLLAVAARVMIMSPNGVEAGGMPPSDQLALRQWLSTTAGLSGVKLESALDHIRHQAPQLNATDAQLAQAILTL